MIYKRSGNRLESKSTIPNRTSPAVFVSEGAQMFVLVEDGANGPWLASGSRVTLCNIHCTGEIRWEEPYGNHESAFRRLSPDAILAVNHFNLIPSRIPREAWLEILDSYEIYFGDLTDLEIQLLESAYTNKEGTGSFTEKAGSSSDEASAMYNMKRNGLINIGISATFDGVTRQMFHITTKGKLVLENGKA